MPQSEMLSGFLKRDISAFIEDSPEIRSSINTLSNKVGFYGCAEAGVRMSAAGMAVGTVTLGLQSEAGAFAAFHANTVQLAMHGGTTLLKEQTNDEINLRVNVIVRQICNHFDTVTQDFNGFSEFDREALQAELRGQISRQLETDLKEKLYAELPSAISSWLPIPTNFYRFKEGIEKELEENGWKTQEQLANDRAQQAAREQEAPEQEELEAANRLRLGRATDAANRGARRGM